MSATRLFQVRADVHCGTIQKHVRSLAITLISLLTVQAMGTQQTQDKLEYNGQKYDIGGNGNFPLESYFVSFSKEDRKKWNNLFRAKNSDGKTLHLPPTNCYRGYVASWTIETNMLVLTAIRIDLRSEKMESVDVLKPIFGDQIKDGKIYALWFDGHITLDGIHEILFFEKGRLTQRKTFQEHNEMFRTDGDLQVSERKTRERCDFSFHEMSLEKALGKLRKKFRESICLEEKQIFTNRMTMTEIENAILARNQGVGIALTNATLDEILDARFNSQSLYQWTRDTNLGIVNIYPRRDAPLDWKIDNLSISNSTVDAVLRSDLLQLYNHNILIGSISGNTSWLKQKVSICATNISARQALNMLTSQLNPKMCWEVTSLAFAPSPSRIGYELGFSLAGN